MPRELPRCSTSSPILWRSSRLTVPTIRTEFTRRLPSVIRMPSSSCRREQPQSRVRPPNLRAKVEAAIGRYKRVIGDALRSRTNETEATEVAIAAAALNRMLEFGRPNYVRIA
jgi:hypothetical protein